MFFNLVVAGKFAHLDRVVHTSSYAIAVVASLRVYAINGRDWRVPLVVAVLLLFEFGANIVRCSPGFHHATSRVV